MDVPGEAGLSVCAAKGCSVEQRELYSGLMAVLFDIINTLR